MMRTAMHILMIALLTVVTQIGGVAWLIGLRFRFSLLAFLLVYALGTVGTMAVAPFFGRVPIGCAGDSSLRMQSWFYCIANRNYVVPEMKTAAEELAAAVAARHPGTVTLALDGNFPFLPGFPLIPHLSHDDGRKLDLAFYYAEEGVYRPGLARSPIGYFAFEDGPTDCRPQKFGLRWDMDWLQPLLPAYELEPERMRTALQWLEKDNRISRIFLEPHLVERLGASSPKVRFQGCAAARHDDHIHIEISSTDDAG